jgi:hypothetical protein
MNLTNSVPLNRFFSYIRTFFIIFISLFLKKFSSNSKLSWYISKILNNPNYRFLPVNFIDKFLFKKIILKKNFFLKLFYKEGYQADKDLKYFNFYYNKNELNLIYFSIILSTFKFYSHNNKSILHEYFIIKLLKKIIFLFEQDINSKDEKFNKFVNLLEIFFTGNLQCVSNSNLKEMNFYFNKLTNLYDKYKYNFKINKIDDFVYSDKIKIGVLWCGDSFNKREFEFANSIFEELKNNYPIYLITNVQSEEINLYSSQYKIIYFDLNNLEESYSNIKNLDLDLCFLTSPKTQNPFHNLSILLNRRLAKKYLIHNSDIVTRGYNSRDIFLIFDNKDFQDQFTETNIFVTNHYAKIVNLAFSYKNFKNNKDIDFFSCASTMKINYELLLSWVKILKECVNSNLVLAPFPSAYFKSNMLISILSKICSSYKVNLRRIKILDINGISQIYDCLSKSKVYLDSYPYTSPTTVIDAASFSIPLVTRTGNLYRSSLSALALESLKEISNDRNYFDNYVKIVHSYYEYEQEAIKLYRAVNNKEINNIPNSFIQKELNYKKLSNINTILRNLT